MRIWRSHRELNPALRVDNPSSFPTDSETLLGADPGTCTPHSRGKEIYSLPRCYLRSCPRFGLDGRIRTCDIPVPGRGLYQTELHLDFPSRDYKLLCLICQVLSFFFFTANPVSPKHLRQVQSSLREVALFTLSRLRPHAALLLSETEIKCVFPLEV